MQTQTKTKTQTHLRRGRTYVIFALCRTYVIFSALGHTYIVFLGIGRTNVDSNDVRTNVNVGVALTSQITYVCRTKLAASINWAKTAGLLIKTLITMNIVGFLLFRCTCYLKYF